MLKELFKKSAYISLGKADGDEPQAEESRKKTPSQVPKGLFVKCPKCSQMVYKEDVKENFYACPKCGGYFRVKTNTRIRMILDKGSFEEWDKDVDFKNPLDYPDYEKKIETLQEKTHLAEAVKLGKGKIDGQDVVFGVCDSRFLMGSMGYAVGEKITRAIERATSMKLPIVLVCCSGGARMQEGIVSLMQMAKTSAALKRHTQAGLLYIPILTDPTTGGVTASFAMLGDIILAEPGALIGFAGPRVIAQTIGQKLPEGFQKAEFLMEHGLIDGVVEREELKSTLSWLLRVHGSGSTYDAFKGAADAVEMNQNAASRETLGAWERVQLARDASRPVSLDYIGEIFDDFMEFHGDRYGTDDGAIIGGIACLDGNPVTVIGIQKGRDTAENVKRNFGMPSPQGYEKALRLMKQAEKFQRPVITFVDTPGAFCGIEAEENGQGGAIARNLMEMAGLRTPVLSIVIGEGGSGGALALAVADEVWMMENAVYSILSPEGFASILWKDSKRAREASGIMKITAFDLYDLGIIEKIIPETEAANERNLPQIAAYMKAEMQLFLEKQKAKDLDTIVGLRYERYRNM